MTHKKYFKFFGSSALRSAVMAGAVFSLSACTSVTGPTSVPTGYTYHHQEYRTPEGKKAIFKTWDQWSEVNQPMTGNVVSPNVSIAAAPDMGMSDPVYTMEGNSSPMMLEPAAMPQGVGPMDVAQWQVAARDLVGRITQTYGLPSAALYVQPVNVGSVAHSQAFEQALKTAMNENGWLISMGPGPGVLTAGYDIRMVEDGRTMLSLLIMSDGMQAVEMSGIYSISGGSPAMMVQQADSSSVYIAPEFQQGASPVPGGMANSSPMSLN
jgi:hypothetical protein